MQRSTLRWSALLGAVVGTAALSVACAQPGTPAAPSGGSPAAGAAGAAATAPAKAGRTNNTPRDTMVVGLDSGLFPAGGLRPQQTTRGTSESFMMSLTRLVSDKIEPMAATSWRVISPTQVEYTLRPGIKFADGTAITPEDVQFSFDYIMDPATQAPQVAASLNNFASVLPSGPDKVMVTTKTPDPVSVERLYPLYIRSKAWMGRATPDQATLSANASGPYAVKQLIDKQSFDLEANPNYYEQPPVKKLSIKSLPDPSVRLAALRTGEVDIINTVSTDQAKGLQDEGLQITSLPRATVYGFHMNPNWPNSPFKDIKVREAVNIALDREGLVNQVFNGYFKPTFQRPAAGIVGHDPAITVPKADPERARRLLAEAGYPNGLDIELSYTPVIPEWILQSEAAVGMLQRAGIRVKLVPVDFAIWGQRSQTNQNGMMVTTLNDFPLADADQTFSFLISPRGAPFGFEVPAFDRAMAASREASGDARARLLQEANRYVVESQLWAPMYNVAQIWGSYPNVKGFEAAGVISPVYWDKMTK
jgi:peptide/nickel transport system substrate-binding protein